MNSATRYPTTTFVEVSEEHLEQLRKWRNSPRIRFNMYSDEPISEEQQASWYEGLTNDLTRRYFVFLQNDRPIGSLYFTDIAQERCSWGCYIGEENVWPGSGLLMEIAALDFAFDKFRVKILEGEVFDFNLAPQRMHEFFEYEFVGARKKALFRNEQWFSALSYRYSRERWACHREAILLRLPKQVRETAKLMKLKCTKQEKKS